jgi:hypothetical protein
LRNPKKLGRPKLPKGQAKGKIVPVRFADDEIRTLVRASRKAKVSTSQLVRNAVLEKYGTTNQPLAAGGSNWSGTPQE